MSGFVSAMRFVGDLDNEFYDDELVRDVWNESSAVGYQLAIWTGAIAMAILPWVAGETGARVTAGLFVAITLISLTVLAYSKSRNVDARALSNIWRPRAAVLLALYLIAGVGVLAQWQTLPGAPTTLDASTMFAYAVGAAVGFGAAAWGVYRYQKRQRALDLTDDDL